MKTKSATKDAILSENIFEKDLSQKIIVKKLAENGLWDSRMGRFGKWNERILKLQNIQRSHLSHTLITQKKTLAAQRGLRLGSALSPEPGIVTEKPGRKCQIHEKKLTEKLDLITDTHLGKIIYRDTKGNKTIRQTSEFILRKKNPVLKKNPITVAHVRRPFVINHYSFNIREFTLKKNLMNVMNVGEMFSQPSYLSQH